MKNKEIVILLERMGTLLEIKGEIIFKTRAYFKAAENINNLAEDIVKYKQAGTLREIPGIGKEIEQKIIEYLDTGKMSSYEKLIKQVPETLLDVMAVPSVGPKKAKLFFDELKIKDIADLEKAIEKGKLLKLPKFQEKTIEKIKAGIDVLKQGQERMNLGTATKISEEFIEQLKKLKEVKAISIAGSLRRGRETIGDIDILVESMQSKPIIEQFVKLPQVKRINAQGDTKSSIMTDQNVQVDLRVIEPKSYGAALLYFTGSKYFNIRIRQISQKKKMKVNEYGIFSVKGKTEKYLAGKTEEDCFKSLNLPFVPPELREEIAEEDIFKRCKIPKLIELKDIKGEVHVHSTYSDGKNSIVEMAAAAKDRGYRYLAISDHSPKLRIAGGVSVADLKKKRKEIDCLNKKMKGFEVLCGSEVEIDTDGNLDYNDKILSELDVVVAAVHSGFNQDPKKMTKRLLKVIQNKHVNIIAHPTGVHLGKRKAYDLDFKEICRACVDHNVFLEINAFPIRLDLNSSNVYFAKSLGVKFVINTDSHRVEHFNHMRHGISVARRGWLTKEDVINTQTLAAFKKSLKK